MLEPWPGLPGIGLCRTLDQRVSAANGAMTVSITTISRGAVCWVNQPNAGVTGGAVPPTFAGRHQRLIDNRPAVARSKLAGIGLSRTRIGATAVSGSANGASTVSIITVSRGGDVCCVSHPSEGATGAVPPTLRGGVTIDW
jgi:hypothetical protein